MSPWLGCCAAYARLCICVLILLPIPAVTADATATLAPVNPDWFYFPSFVFPVLAHPGSPGENPEEL